VISIKAYLVCIYLFQNPSARLLSRQCKHEHIQLTLKALHWLPVKQRISYKILLQTYKCLNGLAPGYLCDLISISQPVRSLRSGSAQKLNFPRTTLKTVGDRSFSKSSPTLWNSLPISLRLTSSLSAFKSSFKS
jgi:hypothetical protein